MIIYLILAQPFALAAQTAHTEAGKPVLEVFVSEKCPHCARAREFLPVFARKHPELKIIIRTVEKDDSAVQDLVRYNKNASTWPPSVPTFVFENRLLVGFESAEITGPRLEILVSPVVNSLDEKRPEDVPVFTEKKQPNEEPVKSEKKTISDNEINSDVVDTDLFGTLSVSGLGLPLFALALGFLDGVNPCAMWVLLFLLSLLVHLKNRKRMALIAGTFVAISGAVYFVFMAAWLNIFLMIGHSAILYWILGVVAIIIGAVNIKDFLAPKRGVSFSIPDSAKPGLYARMRNIMVARSLQASLGGVVLLAVIVNFIELLCTAGIPVVFTGILSQQGLGILAYYAYLGIYIIGYVADDSLMVALAVIALSSSKLTENAGRWLKLFSGAVMTVLGLIMIFRPEWLVL